MGSAQVKNSIWKRISSALFYVVAGLLLLYIFSELFMPAQTIKIFQFKPYVVVTESMEPVINVNDLIIDVRPNLDNLEVGDIITFNADIDYNGTKEVVTHYIYSIGENIDGERTFRTVRNGGTIPDNWILTDADILGRYAFRIPKLGNVINFVKSPFGIGTIAVNVIIIGTIVYIIKSSKRKEEPKENANEDKQQ